MLVVDDEVAPLRALKWELKGFDLVPASSLSEALMQLYAQTFDAIVCDWNLGAAGNSETLFEVSRRLNVKCRHFVVSGEVPDGLAALLVSKAVHRFIAKPWTPHDVRQAVREELAQAAA